MKYDYAIERADVARIDKLNTIRNAENFWAQVRKMCRGTKSDHGIKRWQILAEVRLEELRRLHAEDAFCAPGSKM